MGRSRGGFGTKIHLIADALGNPLTFRLTAAQEADITQAHALLASIDPPAAVIADKGYDADAFVQAIADRGAQAVIPARRNRHPPRSWDTHRYRARHLIENLFARLKHLRRLATRYDKLASHFAAFILLACTCVWMAWLLTGPREALNKSILDFSAPAIGKAWFSDGSQNQWLTATDFGSASLRCGKH